MTSGDTSIPRDTMPDRKLAPAHLTRQEFGKRLHKLLLSKNWTQSDLARQSGLPRDSISVYVRGRSMPTPLSLSKLAQALNVKPEELLPNHVESQIDNEAPAFELKISPNAPETAWVRVNRMMTTKTAMKIFELMEADDVAAVRK